WRSIARLWKLTPMRLSTSCSKSPEVVGARRVREEAATVAGWMTAVVCVRRGRLARGALTTSIGASGVVGSGGLVLGRTARRGLPARSGASPATRSGASGGRVTLLPPATEGTSLSKWTRQSSLRFAKPEWSILGIAPEACQGHTV